MRNTRFVAALVVVLAAGALASTASASNAWSNYHWARTANPFTLKLGNNMSSVWQPYLADASSDWSASSVLKTAIVTGSTGSRRCSPPAGRIEVCNRSYGSNGWLGQAQIWLASDGTHIVQANARMNDSYFNTTKYNTASWRGAVTCQEIGHDFGLDHQDTSGADLHTCMDYASNPATDNTHPNTHDYNQLSTIYGSHLDSSTTIGATVNAGLAGSDNASPVAVERRDTIATSTIEERFADGSRLVTIVLWAVPGAH